MKEVYVFFEKDIIKGVFDNFVKYRKTTFHYILGILVNSGEFKNKLEGGKSLKKEFTKFYSKSMEDLIFKDWKWRSQKFVMNDLGEEENLEGKENEKKGEIYETNYTKITVLKGSTQFKSLNTNLAYIKLSPLYNR
jgi:hypothetical protein